MVAGSPQDAQSRKACDPMKTEKKRPPFSACLLVLVTVCSYSSTFGDSITVESLQDSYLLFEPIVLNMTLHLGEPFRSAQQRPQKASQQERRLERELVIQLRNGDSTLCETMMGTIRFAPTADEATEFHASTIHLIGTINIVHGREAAFVFWDTPGNFVLAVVDRDHQLESEGIPIGIVAVGGRVRAAADLFRAGGFATMPALLGKREGRTSVPFLNVS